MFNKFIFALLSKISLFHHVDDKKEILIGYNHSINTVPTMPRSVMFSGQGIVNGQDGMFCGGEDNTSESIRNLIVRLMHTQPGITNIVMIDPATGLKYDSHRRDNVLVILAEDNSYSEVI